MSGIGFNSHRKPSVIKHFLETVRLNNSIRKTRKLVQLLKCSVFTFWKSFVRLWFWDSSSLCMWPKGFPEWQWEISEGSEYLQGWECRYWSEAVENSTDMWDGNALFWVAMCGLMLWLLWNTPLCVHRKPALPSMPLASPLQRKPCFYVSIFERSHCAVFGKLIVLLSEFNNTVLFSKHLSERLSFRRAYVGTVSQCCHLNLYNRRGVKKLREYTSSVLTIRKSW